MTKELPTSIIVGDLHITDHQPLCRIDNFWETQIRKGEWLKSMWAKYGHPPILQVGDVFEKAKASPACISMVLEHYPPMITIPGNHDLPHHSLSEYPNSALYVLDLTRNDERMWNWEILGVEDRDMGMIVGSVVIDPMPWGEKDLLIHEVVGEAFTHILLAHTMILDGPSPFEGEQASDFLHRFPDYPLILTGHNHSPIVYQEGGRILLNPGSFTRQTVSESHFPRVYLWYAYEGRIGEVEVPHDKGAVSRDHIEHKKERDDRISAFVDKVVERGVGERDGEQGSSGGDGEEVSFRSNLERVMSESQATTAIRDKAYWALDMED